MKKQSKLESVREIAIRNEVPFLSALEIYSRFNVRLYSREIKKGNKYIFDNKDLEDKTFDLTERYFDIERVRELRLLDEEMKNEN